LLSVALFSFWIGANFTFGSEYPSEDTPLILIEPDSIAWCEWPGSPYAGEPMDFGDRYDDIAFIWSFSAGPGRTWCQGFLANESQQEILSAGSAVTTVPWFSTYVHIEVDELAGDGFFGPDDSITLWNVSSWTDRAFPGEEVIGTVAMIVLADTYGQSLGEFSFVIDDGNLYSWRSHDLDWDQPWYDFAV
jgi:hypothetical protein